MILFLTILWTPFHSWRFLDKFPAAGGSVLSLLAGNIAGICTSTALDTSFSSPHSQDFIFDPFLLFIRFPLTLKLLLWLIPNDAVRGKFPPVHSCAIPALPFAAELQCYPKGSTSILWKWPGCSSWPCWELCGGQKWLVPISFLEKSGTIDVARYCRHSSFPWWKVLQTWGKLGIWVLGRGQHSVGYFIMVQQHFEVDSAFLTCVLHGLSRVRSLILCVTPSVS